MANFKLSEGNFPIPIFTSSCAKATEDKKVSVDKPPTIRFKAFRNRELSLKIILATIKGLLPNMLS